MPYRLQEDEELGDGIRRLTTEQLDRARVSLDKADDDPHEAIHDARKRFKKIRGALRLVRDELGQETYKSENVCFRDLGRLLAPLRDAYVHRVTLDRLLEKYDDYTEPRRFEDLGQALDCEYEKIRDELIWEEDRLQRVLAELSQARTRMENWPIHGGGFQTIEESVARVYRRGRKGLESSREAPLPENLHEWRKRVKYLWYHQRILRRIWPAYLKGSARLTHDLSDHLGDAHDFSEFQEKLLAQPELVERNEEREVLLALANQRRRHLEGKAILLGCRIFTEKTKHFVRRIGGYWRATTLAVGAEPPRTALSATS